MNYAKQHFLASIPPSFMKNGKKFGGHLKLVFMECEHFAHSRCYKLQLVMTETRLNGLTAKMLELTMIRKAKARIFLQYYRCQ